MSAAGENGAPVEIGQVLLGKYRVERILGRGGMGIVVAARHFDLDELFAIKLMLGDQKLNAEANERFLREARAAARIRSEHVARTQDVGRLTDGTPYMIMEHLSGSDLKTLLRSRGPFPVQECITYGIQAAETLAEAHHLGIVHRDVKPANLFLTTRRNGTPCIKVLDFGISKHTAEDAVALTATATVGGSPLYMSPEQMRSAKHVDGRTDVWSLGIVLYELLTGTTPFYAPSVTAVAGRVLQDEPAPLTSQRPDIPPRLDALILRCLQKRPEDRYQSMDDLSSALLNVLSPVPSVHPAEPDLPTIPVGGAASSQTPAAIEGTPSLRGSLPSFAAATAGTTSRGISNTSMPLGHPPKTTVRALFVFSGALVLGLLAGSVALLRENGGPRNAGGAAAPTSEDAPLGPAVIPTFAAPSASDTTSLQVVASGAVVEPSSPTPATTSAATASAAPMPATPPSDAAARGSPANTKSSSPPPQTVPTVNGPKTVSTGATKKRRTID